MAEDDTEIPDSLLPYDQWTEEALRLVVVRALDYAAASGLPGGHHFYVTFRTDHPGVVVPERISAKYPEEMTIVLQHQFRNLVVDAAARRFSVTLDFSGIPTPLTIPFDAVTAFADPEVRFGLRFAVDMPDDMVGPTAAEAPEAETPEAGPPANAPPGDAAIVSLDAFRRRTPPKS
jgi:hypothetical protein